MKFIYLFLLVSSLAQVLTIEQLAKITIEDDYLTKGLLIVTDANFEDQPTRIENNFQDLDVVQISYDGRQYQLTTPTINQMSMGATSFIQESTSFLELNNFIRDPLPVGFQYLLVTSFGATKQSGKVTALKRNDAGDESVVIKGLNKPTGICIDEVDKYLYIVDSPNVYQYEYSVSYSGIRVNKEQTTVYAGVEPLDCSVDSYGNVYVADQGKNEILILYSTDLAWGISDLYYSVYSGLYLNQVLKPISLDIYDNLIYWGNSESTKESGSLIQANLDKSTDKTQIKILEDAYDSILGLAAAKNKIYYSVSNEVYSYDTENEDKSIVLNDLIDAKGLCIKEEELYIVDNGDGQIYMVHEYGDKNKFIQTFAKVDGALNIVCANNAFQLSLAIFLILIN